MGLFTIDRTINFSEEKVKKILNIISTSSTDEEIEDKMVAQNVVKLQPDTNKHGFFKKRWTTFLRDFDLYDEQQLTEIGRLYLKEELSTEELIFLLLVRRTVQINRTTLRPFEQILRVSNNLLVSDYDPTITKFEFEKYIALIGMSNDWNIDSVTNLIIDQRQGKNNNPNTTPGPVHFDIWKNLIITAGLAFDSDSIKIKFHHPIIKAILTYFDDVPAQQTEFGIFNDSFVSYFDIGVNVRNSNDIIFNDALLKYQGILKSKLKYAALYGDTEEGGSPHTKDLLTKKEDTNSIDIITEILPSQLTVEELAKILSQMYSSAADGKQSNAIRMFGLKYGAIITENGYTPIEIAKAAGIKPSYDVEIGKGIRMYNSIKENEYGIRFYDDHLTCCLENFNYSSLTGEGINKIFYGVPGCGKSYHIQNTLLKGYEQDNIIRTTFYQDYSNTDFVGQILPKIIKGEDGEKDTVEYIFNPGPFTLALIQAISNPSEKIALVVEEINRGNAPAIFGDTFQLLDRDENSISEYGIVNVGMLDYLNAYEFEVNGEKKHYAFKEIKIPGNMDIFATMNTSDQNVYTLDTAFTRRWAKEHIANDFNGNAIKDHFVPGMEEYTWETFVDAINGQIQNRLDDLQVNEDKQVGAFFIKKSDLLSKEEVENLDTDKKSEKAKLFAYKVLEYLWDDVSKLDHTVIFNPTYKTFEKVVEDYLINGVAVFNSEIF